MNLATSGGMAVRKRLNHRGPLSIDVSSAWYFITICADGHAPWKMVDPIGRAACPHAADFATIADSILSAARWYHEHGKWRLALFLVMPDHLHFIVHFLVCGGVGTHRPTVMEHTIGEFKKFISRQCKIRFQRDFFDTRLRDDAHFAEKFNYILGNPVRKGLCAAPDEWPYSIVFTRDGEETTVGRRVPTPPVGSRVPRDRECTTLSPKAPQIGEMWYNVTVEEV